MVFCAWICMSMFIHVLNKRQGFTLSLDLHEYMGSLFKCLRACCVDSAKAFLFIVYLYLL